MARVRVCDNCDVRIVETDVPAVLVRSVDSTLPPDGKNWKQIRIRGIEIEHCDNEACVAEGDSHALLYLGLDLDADYCRDCVVLIARGWLEAEDRSDADEIAVDEDNLARVVVLCADASDGWWLNEAKHRSELAPEEIQIGDTVRVRVT